jgi:hypothetical protein
MAFKTQCFGSGLSYFCGSVSGKANNDPQKEKKLKVPKREIFVTELFILGHPVFVGDLRTEPKKPFV